MDVIYLDLQNVFDQVPHARLLSKLLAIIINHYGITENLINKSRLKLIVPA